MPKLSRITSSLAVLCLVVASCGADDSTSAIGADRPTVVVTTNILGDVVEQLVGSEMNVVTIMPVGSDPHSFQPSAQQVNQVVEADALIVSGGGFEEGLLDVIETAEADGVPIFEALSVVDTIDYAEGGHHDEHDEHGDEEHADEHSDEEHGDEEHHDDDEEHDDEEHAGEHDHGSGVDPHFFTNPALMVTVAEGVVDFLAANVLAADDSALQETAAPYVAELEALDRNVETTLSSIPGDRRVLITNHEVFSYFAERYDFEVVGTVIPSGSTADGASAQALAELAELITREGVPAIFADTSSSDQLVQTLADEAGEVSVVELYSESLGEADSDGATYIQMVQSNADRVAEALAGGG